MSFLSVNEISAGYGRENVIENISFSLESGTLLGVIGANGSGKTTLLKAMCGILPHRGKCALENTCLEELSEKQLARLVSYIPQRSGITIDISALDVVLMGFNPRLGLLEHPTKQMKLQAMQALSQVGLADKQTQNYLHLSEGQKQLCILARTLVSESKLLLLDEPESALDFRFRHQMLSQLRQWVADKERSAVVTLHDPALALNFCDQLLLLTEREVLAVIRPKEDPLEETEQLLKKIYGNISLQRCTNRSGMSQIVILSEEEK